MKTRAVLLLACLTAATFGASAQSSGKNKWSDFEGLLGNWVAADSSGAPGKANGGACSFSLDLQGAVIVRKNHADYPAPGGRPASTHDDLMVIFHRGDAVLANYHDSEGHEIAYAVIAKPVEKTWTFVSDAAAGAPRYRLTYTGVSLTELKLKFEMAQPDKPDAFRTYIEATLKRQATSSKA